MQSFSPKKASEDLLLAVDFTSLLPNGQTIDPLKTFSVSISSSDDPNASSMLSGLPVVNAQPAVIRIGDRLVTVAPNCALLQKVVGGVLFANYVVSFSVTTTDSQVVVEDVTLTVAKYVP